MSSSCAVQGVVKIKREYLDQVHELYQTPDQGFNSDREKEDVTGFLFGVNVSRYIEDHFTEKAANESFNSVDFETGYITFVSGFSAYQLHDFIERIKQISEAHILYSIYENGERYTNEKVVIENINAVAAYLSNFNNPNFIESEIPFDKFTQDGEWIALEETDYGFGYQTAEIVWRLQESGYTETK